jgi:hypothetical protein
MFGGEHGCTDRPMVHCNVYRHRFFHHRHGASLRAVSGQQCEHRVSDDDLAEFDLDHRQRTKAVTKVRKPT